MRVIYFDTLYERESSMFVAGDIEFKEDAIVFASMGHRYRIETKYIRRIEKVED